MVKSNYSVNIKLMKNTTSRVLVLGAGLTNISGQDKLFTTGVDYECSYTQVPKLDTVVLRPLKSHDCDFYTHIFLILLKF